MDALMSAINAFFSFKAYVMLPLIVFVISLAVRMRFKDAILSTLRLAAGFAGVFIAFDFFVAQIAPAVESLTQLRGLNFSVLDVGWPPLAAITWASPIAPISIPLVIGLNLFMLATGLTKTLYIDIWNFWHFALLGALVSSLSGSMVLGLVATLILAVYSFKMTEWTSADVERELGIPGLSASPVSVTGIVPYTALCDALFDKIPGVRNWNYNPSKSKDGESNLWGEPMVIGVLIGLLLGLAAGYGVKAILELGVNIAAVMFLLPKSAGLIGEAMTPVTEALRKAVERRFPKRKNLVVALDTGFLMHHRSVVVTGLILMPIAILLALVLPGNRVLPLGDLPNLISVMSLSVLMYRGNVIRAVIAGIPLLGGFLWFSSSLAPVYTELAATAGESINQGGLITAFTDGGHHVRFVLLNAFEGKLWGIVATTLIMAACWYVYRRFRVLSKKLETGD